MKATITFDVRLTFEDTRERGVLPISLERDFVQALERAVRDFREGRGLELVKDRLITKFGGPR